MKTINRFFLVIFAVLSLTHLQADQTLQLNLDNDPRFNVELTLPDDLVPSFSEDSANEIHVESNNLIGIVMFVKNDSSNIHLEKWPTLVEDSESKFPGKWLVDSPLVALPTFDGTFATHSLVIPPNEIIPLTFGRIVIETQSYACLVELALRGTVDEMLELCKTIAKGLKFTVLQ